MIRTIIQKLSDQNYINRRQLTYLFGPNEPRPRLFYLLPKIHKTPQSWTVPHKIPPGWPIISDCGSESYRIAKYIDHFSNPLAKLHPSYIKDTYDLLLNSLVVPADTFRFTIDVDALYTNTDSDLCIAVIREAFNRSLRPERPDKEILELLHLTLSRN